MHKVSLLFAVLSAAVFSQEYIPGVSQEYYGGIIYSGSDRTVITDKIEYPGFTRDTVNQLGVGFVNHSIAYSMQPQDSFLSSNSFAVVPHTNFSLSDLYAFNEWNSSAGRFGMWVGNFDCNDNETSKSSYNNNNKEQSALGTCALWFTPKGEGAFKGISLVVGDQYNYSEWQTESSATMENYEYFNMSATSLFALSNSCNFKVSLSGVYGTDKENMHESSTYYDFGYPHYYSDYTNSATKDKSISLACGLLNKQGNQINAGFSMGAYNHSQTSSFPYSSAIPQSSQGDASLFVNCSGGKTVHYYNHCLYYGLTGAADLYLPFQSATYVSLADIPSKLQKDNRYIDCSITAPLTLDVNLFNTKNYAVIRMIPMLFMSTNKLIAYGTTKSLGVSLYNIALGLRGSISDKLEYSLIPSLNSNIFVTGLELRYKFGGKS